MSTAPLQGIGRRAPVPWGASWSTVQRSRQPEPTIAAAPLVREENLLELIQLLPHRRVFRPGRPIRILCRR